MNMWTKWAEQSTKLQMNILMPQSLMFISSQNVTPVLYNFFQKIWEEILPNWFLRDHNYFNTKIFLIISFQNWNYRPIALVNTLYLGVMFSLIEGF